jgi:hypothetical protein
MIRNPMAFTDYLDASEIRIGLAPHPPVNVHCMVAAQKENSDKSTTFELLPFKQPFQVGTSRDVDRLTGVISNGPELLIPRVLDRDTTKEKPVCLANETWEIDIHSFAHTNQLFRNKRQNAGRHAASHWFTARPSQIGTVSDQSIEELISCLSQLLTYARGARVGIFNVCGFRGEKKEFAWLGSTRHDFLGEPSNWFDVFLTDELNELFRLISLAEGDAAKRLPLRRAIEYYRLGNSLQRVSTESGLIMTVASLETLADATLGSDAFSRVKSKHYVSGALRESAVKLGICDQPSSGLADLEAMIKRNNWDDGYHAITEMRNSAMHSTKLSYTSREMLEAWQAAQWLSEVMLAVWIGFRGDFSDRRSKKWVGEKTPISAYLRIVPPG